MSVTHGKTQLHKNDKSNHYICRLQRLGEKTFIFFLQKMAITLAQQLISQLEAKIEATPNDADKFLMRTQLKEHSDILRVRQSRLT